MKNIVSKFLAKMTYLEVPYLITKFVSITFSLNKQKYNIKVRFTDFTTNKELVALEHCDTILICNKEEPIQIILSSLGYKISVGADPNYSEERQFGIPSKEKHSKNFFVEKVEFAD